jgi:hypothetical protein
MRFANYARCPDLDERVTRACSKVSVVTMLWDTRPLILLSTRSRTWSITC